MRKARRVTPKDKCATCGRRVEPIYSGWRHLLTVAGIEAEKDHQGKPAEEATS